VTHDFARIDPAARTNAFCQRLAIDESHHEEWASAELVGAMDWNNVLMREAPRGTRLAKKALGDDVIGCEMRRKRLDGDVPIEAQIAGEVDDAHAAATDLTLQVVLPLERVGEAREVFRVFRRRGRVHGVYIIPEDRFT
jgi:hypothetical protein